MFLFQGGRGHRGGRRLRRRGSGGSAGQTRVGGLGDSEGRGRGVGGKQVSPWGGWSRVPLGPPGDHVLSPPRGAVLSMYHPSPSLPGEGRGRGVPRAAAPLPCAKGEPSAAGGRPGPSAWAESLRLHQAPRRCRRCRLSGDHRFGSNGLENKKTSWAPPCHCEESKRRRAGGSRSDWLFNFPFASFRVPDFRLSRGDVT